MSLNYIGRIGRAGDLGKLLQVACDQYGLGELKSFKVIEVGIEDLNVIAEVRGGGASL